jgi:hypothetical protein
LAHHDKHQEIKKTASTGWTVQLGSGKWKNLSPQGVLFRKCEIFKLSTSMTLEILIYNQYDVILCTICLQPLWIIPSKAIAAELEPSEIEHLSWVGYSLPVTEIQDREFQLHNERYKVTRDKNRGGFEFRSSQLRKIPD